MRSLQKRFNLIQQKNLYWSSYVCFCVAITQKGFSKKIICYWFNRLVEKSDYGIAEKKSILAHLLEAAKVPEQGTKIA